MIGQKYVYHVVCAIKGLVQQLSLSHDQMIHSSSSFSSDTNTATKTL